LLLLFSYVEHTLAEDPQRPAHTACGVGASFFEWLSGKIRLKAPSLSGLHKPLMRKEVVRAILFLAAIDPRP
jgi:hypothetical protein